MLRHALGKSLSLLAAMLLLVSVVAPVWGQHAQGRITVTVLDPQGAVVPGARLNLKDLATNDVRTAETQMAGTYTFVNLNPGKYRLSVGREGFRESVYDVVVESTKTTDIEASLQIGPTTQMVEVTAVAPVVEQTQNAISTVIDINHIENLPLLGRNLTRFAQLGPGFTGTWNGLPAPAQGNNVDGVIGSPSRMKFGGNANPTVQVRVENIEEMTVQSDQMDMNQGFGQGAMQINYVTRRGTNAFHGQVFWDHRNDNLNANSWRNNLLGTPKAEFKLNEFGGSVGGPAIRDKLFFFFSLSAARQPGGIVRSSSFLVPGAQSGGFTYVGTDGQTRTVNVFDAVRSYNAANGANLPTTTNSVIASQMQRINSAIGAGRVGTTTNPIVNSVDWISPNPVNELFPTWRVDYTPTTNLRFNVAVNRTTRDTPGSNSPFFPGEDFRKIAGGNKSNSWLASYGTDWTVSPTLLNSFRFGFNYNAVFNSFYSSKEFYNNPITVGWPLVTTPMSWFTPITTYYPIFNASDTVTWQKGKHTLNVGFSWWREFDHYWNPKELTRHGLGVVAGDPAFTALANAGSYQPLPFASTAQQDQARALYALLTGRISSVDQSYPVDPKTKQYIQKPAQAFNLRELLRAYGLFVQDSWRVLPNLTINAGLRWDFTGSVVDLNGAYHNVSKTELYGPTGEGNLFKPGVLQGTNNPVIAARARPFNSWNVSPQPELGIAWLPRPQNSFLQKLTGAGGDTVIRTSFSLRRWTVPQQYFWNNASDYGSFFYQFATLRTSTVAGTGLFAPGSLSLGQTLPPFLTQPATYQENAPLAQFTFNNSQFQNGSNGIRSDIGQPYTMSWTFGIQRRLGQSRALEVRYNGSRSPRQWISVNLNEVNVLENGFLNDFKAAQSNLAICQANAAACRAAQAAAGVAAAQQNAASFANWGLAGQAAVPIMTAAFTGNRTASPAAAAALFSNSTLITQLNTGAVGAMGQTFSTVGGLGLLFCNMVGASFAPCAANRGYTGAGAGYPINFFQANPYAAGIPSLLMDDVAWSNYHALQVDFRQRNWHGLQYDANYTWSHTLGTTTPNDWTGAYPAYTLRDLRHSYGPTLFDVRHVFNFSGAVDLPFGRGRKFLNTSGAADKVVGGWTVGSIVTWRSGYPFRVLGGYQTFNNIADGGVNLTGVTRDQLQSAIGVFKNTGQANVNLINPQYRTVGVGANRQFISPNTTPGTFAGPLWLYGPGGFYFDLSLGKRVAITERWSLQLQANFLNAFNHPVFGNNTNPIGGNIQGTGWATTGNQGNGPRQIEVRAKISF
jgi:hypothetical protein